jgi:hypothetical protein
MRIGMLPVKERFPLKRKVMTVIASGSCNRKLLISKACAGEVRTCPTHLAVSW